MSRRPTPSQRLLARLRALGLSIPDGAYVQRSYAGRHLRNAGAWSWFLLDRDGRSLEPDIGSQFTVAELLRAEAIEASPYHEYKQVNIDPVEGIGNVRTTATTR